MRASSVIRAPREAVFDFVADMRNDVRWAPRVRDVQPVAGDGPGRGSVYRVHQEVGPRRAEWMEFMIHDYERPQRIVWRCSNRIMDYESRMEFEDWRGGTRVVQTNQERFHGVPLALRPVLPLLVRRQMRRQMRLLRAALEAENREG